MGNVLSKEKREQVIALGRLGWSLRRIEQATGVRRETAGDYLRSAGIALRTAGGWGRKPPTKAATSVTTCSDNSKPAIEVITGFSGATASDNAKAANEVTTGFLPEVTLPEQGAKRTTGASEAYRELIELELSRGRSAMGIWQDLVDEHGFTGGYQSVQRLVLSRCTQIAESVCEVRETALKSRILEHLCIQIADREPRPASPTDVSFAFKSRTNFIANFVRDLTTNIRDFSAMTLQLKRGQY
jgi:hypothetical protein